MCLNETYSKTRAGKYLSEKFPIQNGLQKEMLYRHCFSTFLSEYFIKKVQENQVGLKLDVGHRLLVNGDYVNLLRDNIDTINSTHEL
jgi:hypothetical protein